VGIEDRNRLALALRLAAPDHKLFEAHPTACTVYLDHIVHGRIVTKPGIERFDGKRVIFTDGSEEEIDLLVWATGFRVSFPFMDPSYILDERAAPSCSSILSIASSTIFSSSGCSSRRRAACGSSRLSGAADRKLHRGQGAGREARLMVQGASRRAPPQISGMASSGRTRPGTDSRSSITASANT
jgi:hypothetical protein